MEMFIQNEEVAKRNLSIIIWYLLNINISFVANKSTIDIIIQVGSKTVIDLFAFNFSLVVSDEFVDSTHRFAKSAIEVIFNTVVSSKGD